MSRRYRKLADFVWCHEHGSVHDNTEDPYDYGEPDCSRDNHESIFVLSEGGGDSRIEGCQR